VYINESVAEMMNSYIDRMITTSALDKPIWNIESILEQRPPAWNYIDGLFISGLLSLYYQTQDSKLYDFAIKF